jgi:hypothetical protein
LKWRRNVSRFIQFKYNMGRAIYQGVIFSPQWPGINLSVVHMAFMLDKVALRQVSLRELGFSLSIVIPPVLLTRLSSGVNTIGPYEAAVLWDSVSLHYNSLYIL